jgi:Na+-translocating ferredoxin:NAD+ oxidoreductase RNF subunit RnfB
VTSATAQARYDRSPGGRARKARYIATEHGKEKRRQAQARHTAKKRDYVRKMKGRACVGCWLYFPPEKLHFHHRDPSTKSFNVMEGHSRSYAAIDAEIDKCDVLCSDCHRDAHRALRGWDL